MSAREKALESMRARCKAIYQQIGRDAMLRQNDPVETLFRFALGLTDDNSYVIGFNAGWEEREATWQAAGYRILAPGEVDAETVEKAVEIVTAGPIAGLREALANLGFGGDPADEQIGWRGVYPTPSTSAHFRCEFCKAEHTDCTEIEHEDSCPVLSCRAAINEHYATAIRSLGRRT